MGTFGLALIDYLYPVKKLSYRGMKAFRMTVKIKLIQTENPEVGLGFLLLQKFSVYSEIELETFCFESSGLSMQPDKPTIINAIAKSAKIFFMNISSKRV